MKKSFIVSCLLFAFTGVHAQKYVKDYSLLSVREVRKPLMIDSLDNNGRTFDLARDFKPYSSDMNPIKTLKTDEEGFVVFDAGEAKEKVYTLAFALNCTRDEVVDFKIICDCAFKADFDGKRQEKSNENQDTISCNCVYKAGMYEAVVDVFVSKPCKLKIEFEGKYAEAGDLTMKKPLYLRDMLTGISLYDVDVSAGGKYYTYRYYETDSDGDTQWRWRLLESRSDRLIYEGSLSDYGQWLPESDMLYYAKEVDGKRCVFVLNPEDMSRNVIAEGIPKGSIRFLDNERAFVISVAEQFEGKKGEVSRLLSPEDRSDNSWRDRTDLWLYNLGTKSLNRLTFGHHNVYLQDASQDGKRLLISVYHDNFTERPFGYSSFMELDIENMTLDTLVSDGFVNSARYFGENIVFMCSAEAFGGVAAKVGRNQTPNIYHNTLILFDRKTGEAKPLLKDFNPSVNSFDCNGQKILMQCTDKDSVNLYIMSVDSMQPEKIDLDCDVVSSYSSGKDMDRIYYMGQNYNKPSRLLVYDKEENRELYFPKQKEYERLALGKMETWNFEYGKTTIEGRYYLPYDFDSTRKYPLIVYYYGGTTPTDRTFEMRYSPYLYTALGYVVYVLNPSGTIGYGQEFAARHVNAWGKKTAEEIIEGVKLFCKTHGFINSDKVGCMGASYGGFMTQYLLTRSDIFAAGVSHAGISNITSYWGEGYWGYSYSAAASANSYPWNNPKLYTEQSPLFAADKINTPLLLLHGDSDTNVPVGESIQLYNALKLLGKDVQFVSIRGENHGIVDFEKRLKWNDAIFAWFEKYLQGDDSMWKKMFPETQMEK